MKPVSVQCFNCKYVTGFEKFETNPVTDSKVCPECGYEGGKLTPNDPCDHQDEWDNLFKDDAQK